MSKTFFVLNGPNLNMLGRREPGIYGGKTLADIEADCHAFGAENGCAIDFRQSNHEGVLVDWLHEAADSAAGVAINAGAYTHTSVALHDAIKGASVPVIELHISNVHARESFRHHSYISPAARGIIVGLGVKGYALSMDALVRLNDDV